MSKLVVVLQPGCTPQYLTVAKEKTTINWSQTADTTRADGQVLPIETYYCEGEEFHFARVENLSDEASTSALCYLTAQKSDALIGLMSGFKQIASFFSQLIKSLAIKKIRAS